MHSVIILPVHLTLKNTLLFHYTRTYIQLPGLNGTGRVVLVLLGAEERSLQLSSVLSIT